MDRPLLGDYLESSVFAAMDVTEEFGGEKQMICQQAKKNFPAILKNSDKKFCENINSF